MAKNFVLGIDIGSSAVFSVIAGRNASDLSPKILGVGFSPSLGIRRGKIIGIEDVAGAIKSSVATASKRAGVRPSSAILAIAGPDINSVRSRGLIMVSRASGEISEFDARRALEQAQSNVEPLTNRDVLHSFPLSFTVDGKFKTVSPVGMSGSKLECDALFVTALSKDVRNAARASELAGFVAEDVVAGPMATAKAVLPRRHREVGSALLDIGAGTSSLAVFEEGQPLSLEVFRFGSDDITGDIAIGLKVSLSEAEEIKKNFSPDSPSPNKKQTAEIISARLSDIFELANKHLKKIDRVRLLPAGAVLTGGGSKISDISSFAKDYLELPASAGELEDVRMPDGLDSSCWATAVGVCLMALDEGGKTMPPMGDFSKQMIRWIKSFLP